QKLTLTATSPETGISFSWTPVTNLSNPTIFNPIFTPAAAGNYLYTATATNASGCIANSSVTLKVIDARCGFRNKGVMVCFRNKFDLCTIDLLVPVYQLLGFNVGSCETTVTTANPATNKLIVPDNEGVQKTV